MAVYVDDMRVPYGSMIMCHMLADTSAELHAMARKIGVRRKWCQNEGTYREHYDVAITKRNLAVRCGAVEITWREAGEMDSAKKRAQQHGQ